MTYILIVFYVVVTPPLAGYVSSPEVRYRVPVVLGEFYGRESCDDAGKLASKHLGGTYQCSPKTKQ